MLDIGHASSGSSSGDIADAAFGASGDELASQLAEMESNELGQIEIALQRIVQGRYGLCDLCEKKIPVGRLNALPYSVMCVACQQQAEKNSSWRNVHAHGDWSALRDRSDDAEVDLSRLQIDMSK